MRCKRPWLGCALVEPLDGSQLRAPAYPSEWTIADTLAPRPSTTATCWTQCAPCSRACDAVALTRVDDVTTLRPIERRVSRLADDGVLPAEIGRRFNRSEGYIEQVLVLAGVPGRAAPPASPGLRPIERRLLRWREQGASPEELADRFRRGPGYIERVLALADYKQRP
jgi:hypothetical protein